jgi:hypothetical protein
MYLYACKMEEEDMGGYGERDNDSRGIIVC